MLVNGGQLVGQILIENGEVGVHLFAFKLIEGTQKAALEEEVAEAAESLRFWHAKQEHERQVSHALHVAYIRAVNLWMVRNVR